MKNLLEFKFADGKINEIVVSRDSISFKYERWDAEIKTICFNKYYVFLCKDIIGLEIGGCKINLESTLINGVKNDLINSGADVRGLENLKHCIFYDSWSERVLFEIVFEEINVS